MVLSFYELTIFINKLFYGITIFMNISFYGLIIIWINYYMDLPLLYAQKYIFTPTFNVSIFLCIYLFMYLSFYVSIFLCIYLFTDLYFYGILKKMLASQYNNNYYHINNVLWFFNYIKN